MPPGGPPPTPDRVPAQEALLVVWAIRMDDVRPPYRLRLDDREPVDVPEP